MSYDMSYDNVCESGSRFRIGAYHLKTHWATSLFDLDFRWA